MSEIKRGSLQSPADTVRTTDTIVRHAQVIGADGCVMPSGATASAPINTAADKISSYLINEGLLFRNAYKYDVGIGAVAYMLIKAGIKYPNVIFSALADGDTRFEIYHTPTISADGAEELSGNFNFNSANTSLTTWFPTPTVTDDGSYIANTWILGGSGTGTPAASEGAGTLSDFNIILIPSVEFLIKFTNHSGRAIQILFEAIYRETTEL